MESSFFFQLSEVKKDCSQFANNRSALFIESVVKRKLITLIKAGFRSFAAARQGEEGWDGEDEPSTVTKEQRRWPSTAN